MATNDFKPFATGASANVTSQTDWSALPALLSGFQSGKASSAQVNKALRQATFVAAALAQFVSDKSGQNVLDDGNLAGFVSKLTAGFANQYLSRSNPFGDIKTDGAAAISTALANLGLGDAKFVISRGGNTNGNWVIWSDGSMEVMGGWQQLINGLATVTYPIELPTASRFISIAERASTDSALISSGLHISTVLDDTVTKSGFKARCMRINGTPSDSSFSWRVYCAAI